VTGRSLRLRSCAPHRSPTISWSPSAPGCTFIAAEYPGGDVLTSIPEAGASFFEGGAITATWSMVARGVRDAGVPASNVCGNSHQGLMLFSALRVTLLACKTSRSECVFWSLTMSQALSTLYR
jgi:hypothetical protein